uniref:Hemerythrin n=1 Tax=Magelona berkeleyi TaxID=1490213 RepID=A0A1S6QD10_9ANNE|nr:hemerythrin [Magelona berkeleyi]
MSDFKIPEPYIWDESFRVFYDNLDEEHKNLFKGIFNVAGDRGSQTNYDSLLKVVKHHFADEEGMMSKANYGGFAGHKAAHDDFVDKLSGLKTPLSDGDVNYAKEWLVNHIKGIDFKYKKQL